MLCSHVGGSVLGEHSHVERDLVQARDGPFSVTSISRAMPLSAPLVRFQPCETGEPPYYCTLLFMQHTSDCCTCQKIVVDKTVVDSGRVVDSGSQP